MNLLNKLVLTVLCASSFALPQTYTAKVGETIIIEKLITPKLGYRWYFVNPETYETSRAPMLNDTECVRFNKLYTRPLLESDLFALEFPKNEWCHHTYECWELQAVKPGRAVLCMEWRHGLSVSVKEQITGCKKTSGRNFEDHTIIVTE